MTTEPSDVQTRMPVWKVLSELFLDTELQESDHLHIARVLAASPFSQKKLSEILRFEVTPALKSNLLSVAGEWAGFDDDWLLEQLLPRLEFRPFFKPRVFWMFRRRWSHILDLVTEIRNEESNKLHPNGGTSDAP